MSFLYNFGFSQEDERTEAAALGLAGRRVLSVASAGDMPLSLLALGAERVVAVDVDPAQLHLCQLKLAAVTRLSREEAVAFLGFVPAAVRDRRALLSSVSEALPGASRAFWQEHGEAVLLHGPIWAGRYERFVRRFSWSLSPLLHRRARELIGCESVERQAEVFARRFDGWFLRGLFRLAFHPVFFSRRGMDPRSLAFREPGRSLGEQYFGRLRTFCTATLARDNPWLQLHTLGRVMGVQTVPSYLTPAGFAAVRDRRRGLDFVQGDLTTYLAGAACGELDAFHLSNLPDWLPQPAFDELLRRIIRVAARPARLVWRYLHVDREPPEDVKGLLRLDRRRGVELGEIDRFPFYGVVPATL